MDSTEIQTYELQLEQVQAALVDDPDNEEMHTLEEELRNLIAMTRELLEQQEAEATAAAAASSHGKGKGRYTEQEVAIEEAGPAESATSKAQPGHSAAQSRQYAAGEEVLAKYAADGRWYPARITSIGGSVHNRVYSIVFKGYNTTELLSGSDIKPSKSHSSAAHQPASGPAYGSTSATSDPLAPAQPDGTPKTKAFDPNAEKERKKRRVEKSKERHAVKAVESQSKQQAWQKFAKKKGAVISGASGKSMFRTPDDPLAKVGVVGAGRGMTQTVNRSKHVYETN
ncbi:hypothetical protein V8E36_006499 [Tilletia maclaganii]